MKITVMMRKRKLTLVLKLTPKLRQSAQKMRKPPKMKSVMRQALPEGRDYNKKKRVQRKRKGAPRLQKRNEDPSDNEEDDGECEDNESDVDDEDFESSDLGPITKCSHHKKIKCRMPGCKTVIGDIKRHLQTHVQEEIQDEEIPKAAAIMKAGLKQRGLRIPSKKRCKGRLGRFFLVP